MQREFKVEITFIDGTKEIITVGAGNSVVALLKVAEYYTGKATTCFKIIE